MTATRSLLNPDLIPTYVREVADTLVAAGFRAVLVGGCVRDMLRGEVPADYDIASSALPGDVANIFRKTVPTGISHGTITVIHRGRALEVTTFRSEGAYLDGRHPSEVTFHGELQADLARRDFTVNAIAFDLADGIVDPFGGIRDLQEKRIRCVGSASERFAEDGLRPLRAVRFATTLAFELDPLVMDAIPASLSVFRKVAMERIRSEFEKILLSPSAREGMGLLKESGLLGSFFPEVVEADWSGLDRLPKSLAPRLAMTLLGIANPAPICARLTFPKAVADSVCALVRHSGPPTHASSDADLRRYLSQIEPAIEDALALAEARGLLGPYGRMREIAAERPPLTVAALAITGQDVMNALAIPPSSQVGATLRKLLEEVLEDPSRNTRGELLRTLARWKEEERVSL